MLPALHCDVKVDRLEFHFDGHELNGAPRAKFVCS